ncbi:RNA polymerase sigma factor [Lacinutrix neustonica]|uniref:RNA polymerase sigma factor n=1 Tax=Lacinutrix neustonica TaxID=2980107 RepID=UPI0036F33739
MLLLQKPKTQKNNNYSELYNAIGKLKKIDRLIIMMVLENQDYDSISEVIGIKPINVRVKIHRIKKRLETLLKNNKNE